MTKIGGSNLSAPAEATPVRGAWHGVGSARSKIRTILVCLALFIAAAPPRLLNLGELSFYADEELTALAGRAMAAGKSPEMPTGMPYYRAYPFTLATSASARYFGIEEELSYRLPAALMGTLTVPLLYVVGSSLVGPAPALVGSILLAVSEWHLIFSRMARMYAPFVFFFLAATWAMMQWARTGRRRDFLLALVMFTGAVSLHKLGLTAMALAPLALLLKGWSRIRPMVLLPSAGALILVAWYADALLVGSHYSAWTGQVGGGRGLGFAAAWRGLLEVLGAAPIPWLLLIGAGLGLATGLYAAWRSLPKDRSEEGYLLSAALVACGVIAGGFAGVGQIHGAGLACAVFLLLHPSPRLTLLRSTAIPIVILGLLAIGSAAISVANEGVHGGLKALFRFPFPYLFYLAQRSPGAVILFVVATIWLAFRIPRPEDYGVRIAVLVVLFPLAAMGSVSAWAGTRYLLMVYPFLLLAVGVFLLQLVGLALPASWRHRAAGSVVIAAMIAVSGILGGHGLPQTVVQVRRSHGDLVKATSFPVRPDHKAPGLFVRSVREEGDILIAEDASQMRWYAGPVDYWFRRFGDARRYLYLGDDGKLRDIYAGAIILDDQELLHRIVDDAPGRVFLVTSAETYSLRSWYLSEEQRAWLNELEGEQEPSFEGRDGVTRVYCLNCSGPRSDHHAARDAPSGDVSIP